jgi:hypothetical protein
MYDGKIAFKKGKSYNGYMLNDECGVFNSEISEDHSLDIEYIVEHLKVFKFGR